MILIDIHANVKFVTLICVTLASQSLSLSCALQQCSPIAKKKQKQIRLINKLFNNTISVHRYSAITPQSGNSFVALVTITTCNP